jgi:hypothetical protein
MILSPADVGSELTVPQSESCKIIIAPLPAAHKHGMAWWHAVARLLLLTLVVVGIHGYHPDAEDGGVYLAAIEHRLNPRLFPADADFFALKLQATVYDRMIAGLVRGTHVPPGTMLFLLHLLTVFGFLAACYRIASRCFEHEHVRWCGVMLVGVFLTLPVAGTGLYIMDQYLVPRAISATLALFAIDYVLRKRYAKACATMAAALLLHPVIGAFGLSFCFFLWAWTSMRALRIPATFSFVIPFATLFHPNSALTPALRRAINMHHYCDLAHWTWYEWLGVIGPILILFGFAVLAKRRTGRAELRRVAMCAVFYGTFQTLVAMLFMLPATLEGLRPLEPMRYLHLLYVLMILLGGCLMGEYLLKNHMWRWAVFFIPAALGMFLAQRALFPATPHLELPGTQVSNQWMESFEWIRDNTPENAYFVLGPSYLHRPGEDSQIFRGLAQRSVLADTFKDSGMVLTSAPLANRWQREVDAQQSGANDWQHISSDDLHRLKAEFGVNWAVLERPSGNGFDCPYQNDRVAVCRIN